MKSPRPYLLRALIDWIVDSDCTPYMVVDCNVPGVQAPQGCSNDGKLVLNVSADATRNLSIDEHAVSLDCRFSGRHRHISVPIGAVVSIHAKESGLGMSFPAEEPSADAETETLLDASPKPKPDAPRRGGAKLRRVK